MLEKNRLDEENASLDGLAVFNSDEIRATVSVTDLIDPLAHAMISVSDRTVSHPPRHVAEISDAGKLGVMYGSIQDPPVHGAKILSLYPNAPASGLSSHQGSVLLFDSRNGRPIAVFDADVLTAIRTAAITILATATLANPNPEVITICGAGEQAEWHVRGFLNKFKEARIRVWSRNENRSLQLVGKFPGDADRIEWASSLEAAVREADIITTVTSSKTAFLPGALLEPGQHVNLVGASLANAREIDDEGVMRLSLFTDALSSSQIESGEVIEARKNGKIGAEYEIVEIGDVLSGQHPGRISENQITAYKSHGLIVQDLAAAYEIYRSATCF